MVFSVSPAAWGHGVEGRASRSRGSAFHATRLTGEEFNLAVLILRQIPLFTLAPGKLHVRMYCPAQEEPPNGPGRPRQTLRLDARASTSIDRFKP